MSRPAPLTVALLLALALLASACTHAPAAAPEQSPPTGSPTPSGSPTVVPVVSFDARATLAYDRVLAVRIGPREAASAAYRRAAGYAARRFTSWGYTVTRQRFPVPAGKSQGIPVGAGFSQNVIATPAGYDPSKPHLVVGGHLDTVSPSPGGNDNGSGAAMVLELARLASVAPTKMPIVWIEFGAEERRQPGNNGATFGSRYYVAHMPPAEARSLRGMLAIDMVGHGPQAFICHESLTGDGFVDALLATANRLRLRAQQRVVVGLFSDHYAFEHAGYVVGWLWSGEDPTFHTPRDTIAEAQLVSIDRIGRIAWETLRMLRL